MLGSVTACVTSSCCYSSFSLDEFLDMPENKILSLTTACLCKADPCIYSCLRCRFQLFRNFESTVLSWCLKPCNFCSFRGCSSLWLWAHTTGWRHVYVVWIWPLDIVLNSFLQSFMSESFEMSILLF